MYQKVRTTSPNVKDNKAYFDQHLKIDENFDLLRRDLIIGGRESVMYLMDGFCKDDLMQKIMQYLYSLTADNMPKDSVEMSKKCMPYVEVDLEEDMEKIKTAFLSGVIVLFIDGFIQAILIDARTYPARSVEEPEKDKSMRGSKDGFVETIVFNTALIRRRIRDPKLRMEMLNAGSTSKTDIVLCYMDQRADKAFVEKLKSRIQNLQIDALSMNQQSLAENIYKQKWFNPFPKFKFSERPDTAAAQVLEGSVIVLVDNSPLAMILPTTVFDVMEEADDYYFPPITGTYLRITRFLIAVLMYFVTPTYLLLMNHSEWIPESFSFILMKEQVNIPIFWQFLILELALDGLRLAAVNTPNMLSTPLSVMAALILGEFSVNSGWFNGEVMLYMAFVALATYTQPNYEMGYALKFMRILGLILTQLFGIYGYIAGIFVLVLSFSLNRTVSGTSYIYPLLPCNMRKLMHQLFRARMK